MVLWDSFCRFMYGFLIVFFFPLMCVGRPAYYSLFGLIVISILSVLVNTFISRIHPHPEDKVHPITEVVVVAAGGERGGALGNESSEDPPVARLVISTPVKVSSVAPLQSSASSASSNVSRAALSPPSLAPSSSLPRSLRPTRTGLLRQKTITSISGSILISPQCRYRTLEKLPSDWLR